MASRSLTVVPVGGPGAEDVVVGGPGPHEGCVFTGTSDGVIRRVSHDGRVVRAVADTGGRPLGIEWLADGRLLVCDARRGLLAVDPTSGSVEQWSSHLDGRPFVFCNNAAVADDGTVFFSDSSTVHPIDRWEAEVLELTGTGRLLRRRTDGELDVLLDGLQFANGVALSADGTWVVVAETSVRRLRRVFVAGPRAGESEIWVDDLPGFPDNLARGTDGLVWVTIASPADPVVERLQTSPMWMRRTASRLPGPLRPSPKRTIRVQAYDGHGGLVHDIVLDDEADTRRFHMVTGVREHDGRVWLGSLHEPSVAVVDLVDRP
jgi:sugar lactone lactonase YvrE